MLAHYWIEWKDGKRFRTIDVGCSDVLNLKYTDLFHQSKSHWWTDSRSSWSL